MKILAKRFCVRVFEAIKMKSEDFITSKKRRKRKRRN